MAESRGPEPEAHPGGALPLVRATPFAQTLEPIRYTVSFPAPHTHYVEIEASYPTEGRPSIELMMAVWTPGFT